MDKPWEQNLNKSLLLIVDLVICEALLSFPCIHEEYEIQVITLLYICYPFWYSCTLHFKNRFKTP